MVDTERELLIRVAARHGPECWAEDAIHDAWIKVQRGEIHSIPPLPTDEHLRKWFLRIVCNEARNRRRTEGIRYCEQLDEVGDAAVKHPRGTDPFLKDMVADAVSDLPGAQREVSELRLSGWKFGDIASESERTVGTVTRLWYRARDTLRRVLRPYRDR